MMEALSIAYDIPENRPFWKTRPLAIGMIFLIGILARGRFGPDAGRPEFRWLAGGEGVWRLSSCLYGRSCAGPWQLPSPCWP